MILHPLQTSPLHTKSYTTLQTNNCACAFSQLTMTEFRVLEKQTHAQACRHQDHGDYRYGETRHRRSKRNLKNERGGASHPVEKDHKESFVSPSVSASRLRSPSHGNLSSVNNNTFSNHRATLEKDVEQLQLRLQQERSMRILLERAMGRASSTLSPGHRHFTAQTKDLIAEIELLEEEVTSREQQVLSLYRSIFEQCVSRPSSQQSSAIASPAHIRQGSRKHPSIISSAFCSSKNPLYGPFKL
ncbi:hypothetical protein ACSQ67_007367 [Phaseolus vulgaris]